MGQVSRAAHDPAGCHAVLQKSDSFCSSRQKDKIMHVIQASVPSMNVPAWAVLQRRLFDEMRAAAEIYLHKYTRDDGSLIWRDAWINGRDGVDDFYEAFVNWPLLYLLGGDDWFLAHGQREWDAITRQMESLGVVRDEYELGYDQFHQSEHYTYFYFLCLANPTNRKNIDRAKRFADLYVEPRFGNYDPSRALIRAPHNGAGGPRWGFFDGGQQRLWRWSSWMTPYGLPFDDVEGLSTLDDLREDAKASRMGEALHARYGKGDVAANLGVISLIANAFVLTGDAKYRRWIEDYAGVWLRRAAENGGLIPDNAGLNGLVGEYLSGKWYGGLYGWQWPHGYYNIGMATIVAAAGAWLTSGDARYLDLPRQVMDKVWSLGKFVPAKAAAGSLAHHFADQIDGASDVFVVPYRHGDAGWFDWQPMSPIYPAALWNLTRADEDWQRIERIRLAEKYDWSRVIPHHNKEDSGHEQPWLRFLCGENAAYPEAILQASLSQVRRRMALIEQDHADLAQVNIHHWQQLNPVTTEALVQLTLGAPQPIYNGGLLVAPLRYFDGVSGRPGLPRDVAALVTRASADELKLQLINISTTQTREVVLQAGSFAEHRFEHVTFPARVSEFPGSQTAYAAPALETARQTRAITATRFKVVLPAGSEVDMTISMTRNVNVPGYGQATEPLEGPSWQKQ